MTASLWLLSGVLLALCSAAAPPAWWPACAGSVAVFAAVLSMHGSTSRRRQCHALALLLFGLALTWSSTLDWLALRVPIQAGATRALIEGEVVTIPEREGTDLRFDLEGSIVDGAGIAQDPSDRRLRRARVSFRDPPIAPRVGERWRLLVRLTPLIETRNFMGPDTARYAFRERIHLTGRALPSVLNSRLGSAVESVDTLRQRIAARIRDQVIDPDAAALLVALAVGVTDGVSHDQWRVFNATGTTHLVAISGLHVTMFALVAFAMARRIWRWLPWIRVEREPFAMLLGLVAAGAYSLLAGFTVPTQRTWLMLALFASARLAARHGAATRAWPLALIAVLLLDPFAPLATGFWLSFVAVGVLMTHSKGAPPALGAVARFADVIRLQSSILLALAPLTLAVFDGLSIAALWVNLIAIPLVSFVLVPLVLVGALAALCVPACSHLFFALAAMLYDYFWPALVWAADGALSLWHAMPPLWWFPLAFAAGAVLLCRWPWPLRATAVCAALPLVFATSRMPDLRTAHVSVLDAGRGSAVLVYTHSHVLLFDTGDSWNTRGSRLRELIMPALDEHGRTSVDLVVLPTLNDDRARGAALLAFERGADRLLVGGGWPGSSLPAARCTHSEFRWDGVDFQIFAAGAGRRFCAVRIDANGHSVLLAGDLDAAAERMLVASRATLSSDVALMSRQASSLSSAPEWIEASRARLAIATGGIDSESREVTLERWRRAGAVVLDTRRDGGIELAIGTATGTAGVELLGSARTSRYPFVWRRAQ